MDNKSLHIWEKRNELMKIARGTHLTWLDDDDDVSDEYVSKLTETIEANPDVDVISFDQMCFFYGDPTLLLGFSAEGPVRVIAEMGNPHEDVRPDPSDPTKYADTLRPPFHWCCWKTSLASSEAFRASFSHGGRGQSTEDVDWLQRLYPKVEESVYLKGHYLHIYKWSSETTESVL